MSQATFTVKSFDAKPGKMDFLNMMDRVIAGRANIDFESTVEIVDPSGSELDKWEVGYHQTLITAKQGSFYSDPRGRDIYEHVVDTTLTPANDRIELKTGDWMGWYYPPLSFSATKKVLKVTTFDRPSCGGRYFTLDKKGSLTRTSLTGQFCTSLVARKSNSDRTKGELQWLGWVRWDINLAAQVDPVKFKLTPGADSGTFVIKQGKQGDAPPIVPAIDHVWKDKESWYSIVGTKRTLLNKEP